MYPGPIIPAKRKEEEERSEISAWYWRRNGFLATILQSKDK